MKEKKPPGRPEERLVIEDADGALDALLGKGPSGGDECAICAGVTTSPSKVPEGLEKGRPDGHSIMGKSSSEYSIWLCSACGAEWHLTRDSGQWGHDSTWTKV